MTQGPSRAIRLFGTEQADAPLRTLQAGPLSAEFDNGALRYIRIAGVEVLRGIYFLVRDENWGTFTPRLENLQIEEGRDAFRVTYRAVCEDAVRRLVYDARILGKADGSLSFEASGMPETEVLTNRTGFIVLHPIEQLAGKPVRVVHEDGRKRMAAFPEHIDPRCPFTDLRALAHEVVPGLWATCTMQGDAFEMEDQRNWSDASYKTYVRPLRRPWPYTLPKGEAFAQAVRLHVDGVLPQGATDSADRPVTIALGDAIGPLPRIGIGLSADAAGQALDKPELLKALAPRWLVCQVDLRLDHGPPELKRYRSLSEVTGAPAVLEIITRGTLDPDAELQPLAEAVRAAGLQPEAVTVFPAQDMKSVQPDAPWPPMPSFAETYAAARRAFPGVTLGGGMAAYFTELNRKRPPAALLDYVTFTTCPNVHAADDVSVMETLEAVPHLIRSTRAFMGDALPVRIGPSQLGCRENAYGKATAPNDANGRVCLSRLDPRQRGLFNAAWTVGYVAACASEGVDAVALGDFTGPFGHAHAPADFVQPWYDDEAVGAVFPSFHVMAGLAALHGATALSVPTPPGLAALAATGDDASTLWLANLSARPVSIELPVEAAGGRMSMLAADSFVDAARDPRFMETDVPLASRFLTLDAYAVARIIWR